MVEQEAEHLIFLMAEAEEQEQLEVMHQVEIVEQVAQV
jgi:hypothetical protein